MPDIIQLLPDALANQIAAGEVIQRPSSVVKELLENAVDAGATSIKLIIKDSGKTLIQVIDNGSGMTETDARMAFERHATSKIRKTEDLFNILTKGFRGEALASIAAVSKVELKTRNANSELGVLLKVENSEVIKQEPCSIPAGSNFSVKQLFFNVPARRKFLKSDPVELRHILDEFVKVSLAHPEIGFSCFHNDNNLYQLEIASLRQRIVGLFNKSINDKLIPVEETTDILQVHGFIGKPEYAKKSKGNQFFFVNNRFIKSPYLAHAVRFAFDQLLPEKAYPFFVLFIDIKPEDVDINVHPTKQEVKFENERLIYNYIKVSVRHALGKYSITPVLDFDNNVNHNLAHQKFQGSSPTNQNFGSTASNGRGERASKSEINAWNNEFEELMSQSKLEQQDSVIISSKINNSDKEGSLQHEVQVKAPLQLDKRFIISQIKSGLVVIDQQTAHERIIYERLLNSIKTSQSATQQLLFPISVELDVRQGESLKSILTQLQHIGFDISEFGQQTFIIRGIPAHLDSQMNPEQLIMQFLNHFMEDLSNSNSIEHKLCRAMARSEAVKRGTSLVADEMQGLIDQLFGCEMPYTGPSGRKCFVTISLKELDLKFNQ
jgi:DNA mismatch repair protein MutL